MQVRVPTWLRSHRKLRMSVSTDNMQERLSSNLVGANVAVTIYLLVYLRNR